MTVTLPETLKYGYVKGRYILAIGDQPDDADSLPNAVPAVGTITFSPALLISKETTVDPPTTVIRTTINCTLDSTGRLTDPAGALGVYLITGVYKVSYNLTGVTIAPHDILVTNEHTSQNPLDLTLAAPSSTVIVTPSQYAELSARIDSIGTGGSAVVNATTDVAGISELATTAETVAGTDIARVVTPAGVKAALDAKTVSDMSTYAALAHDHDDDYAPIAGGLFATERRTYTQRLLDLRRTAKSYNTIESFSSVAGWSYGTAETIDGLTTMAIHTHYDTIKDYGSSFAIAATQIRVIVRYHVTNADRLASLRLYLYDASGSNGYGGILTGSGSSVEGWNITSTTLTMFSNIGTPPGWANLQKMRFKVYPVTSPNYPTVNVAEVSFYSMQPMCSIWFDDGHESVVTKALPIMDAKGFTGSLTVQGKMDYYGAEHMTAQQHRDLAQAGWDLSNHTFSHPNLSILDEAGNDAEISRGLDIALKLGGGAAAYHFVPPMGRTNAYTLAAAAKYATVMRRNSGANALPVADYMALTSYEPAKNELATTTISVIDGAIGAQTWLILLFHMIGGGDPTLSRNVGGFQSIIDHLDANRASITTLPPTLAIARM